MHSLRFILHLIHLFAAFNIENEQEKNGKKIITMDDQKWSRAQTDISNVMLFKFEPYYNYMQNSESFSFRALFTQLQHVYT